MRNLRKIKAIALSFVLFVSFFYGNLVTVEAKEVTKLVFENNCSRLSDVQAETIFAKIEKNIMQRFGNGYSFENYEIVMDDVNSDKAEYIIDIDVYVDMALISNPLKSAYIAGMQQEVVSIKDDRNRELAQKVLEETVAGYLKNYNQAQRSVFCYRVFTYYESDGTLDIDNARYYHRVDITDEETDLAVMPDLELPNPALKKSDGQSDVRNLVAKANTLSSVSYNKEAAAYYATIHATDPPEYNASNYGSDCANFVSRCIYYGGIPIDYAGEWYPSASYGGMAGDNWWRTGYNDNGGVEPYMVGKGYFSQTTSSRATMGSFMYWNDWSHVALVTYTDYNGTIKYSQHSNTTQSTVYHVYSSTMDVNFYAPNV